MRVIAAASVFAGVVGFTMFASAATQITQMGSDIDGEAATDLSGVSVSLSSDGTEVAIGAYGNDGNGSDAGHVRVYEWSGSAWVQKGGDIDGEAAGDVSGRSVSLSSDGTEVAIGAYLNDGTASSAGHVRVYEWSGSAWVQKGGDIDGEALGDYSGYSVSLSSDGTEVAIGAYGNDGNGSNAGHVRIYEWSGSAWVQKGGDIDGEAASDFSGYSVSLSSDGTEVAIGAYGNDGNGSNAGHVRIYEWSGSAWVQKGGDIDGEAASDFSGYSVSLSSDGTEVAIGAYLNDGGGSNAGHVRVYEWSGSAWVQKGGDINGEATDDLSGISVSLSSDGTEVAIGAYGNDGNGSNAGHVRIYEWSGSAWVQKGGDINGEATDDNSGFSVSLSSDGTEVAIGAYTNDGNGSDAGHVRIYSISTVATLNITYDSQGGNAISDGDTTTITGGTISTLPTDPNQTGYTFTGWYTASSGGTQITTNTAHNQTADFTLYAHWTANTLNITYDSQGGNAISDGDTTTTTGGTISTLPTDPTQTGYTFTGWYTASSGGTQITTNTAHNQTADFTLYAHWTANTPPVVVAPPPPVPIPPPPVTTVPVTTTPALPTTPTIELVNPPAFGESSVRRSDGLVVNGVIQSAIVGNVSAITIRNSDGTEITVTHEPTLIRTNYTVYRGRSLTISGDGYQPDTDIDAWLNSNLTYLGATTTADDGSFSFDVVVPDDFELGDHTLQIEGTLSLDVDQATFLGLKFLERSTDTPQLPITGSGSGSNLPTLSLVVLFLGLLVGLLSRQRRTDQRPEHHRY